MRQKVIDILFHSFYDNGSVNFVIKQDDKKERRIRDLLEYSYEKGERFGKVYLSENEEAAAIVIDPAREKFTRGDIRLITRVIGMAGLPKVLKREKNLKQLKPKGKVLYFWYVGVKPEAQGKGQGTQLIEQIIADYPEYHIHLQTSNPRNFPLYEKMGFRFDGDYEQRGYAVKLYTFLPTK